MPDLSYDLEFLLRAAGYGAPAGTPHSEAARKAVDVVAERMRTVAELQLKVAQERAKTMDPAALAAEAEQRGFSLS